MRSDLALAVISVLTEGLNVLCCAGVGQVLGQGGFEGGGDGAGEGLTILGREKR